MTDAKQQINKETGDLRAKAFVSARQNADGIAEYPGKLPESLAEAYDIQDEAISLWNDELEGWKVGRILGEYETRLGVDRLAGPVFSKVSYDNAGQPLDMPVFGKGFAAVEGEVIAVIGKDAAPDKLTYSTDEALDMIRSLNMGVEIASSPFVGINEHGPLVTISDFGNNLGLILGDEIEGWNTLAVDDWVFETVINGASVGRSSPAGIPGGPVESVRFLLENTARRGLPLKAGMKILTGAVTGVHQAYVGDVAYVTLGSQRIDVKLVDASGE